MCKPRIGRRRISDCVQPSNISLLWNLSAPAMTSMFERWNNGLLEARLACWRTQKRLLVAHVHQGEQMNGGRSLSKQGGFLSHAMRAQRDCILSSIEGQVRMEVLLGDCARRFGLERPRRLREASHLQLMKAICFALGEFRLAHLGDGEYEAFENAKDGLSQDNKQLLERYKSGEDVLVALSDSKGTRTRQTLLDCGVDIALPRSSGLDPFQRSLSGQIAIDRMARFGRRTAELTVTAENSRRISSSLLLMLRHARDGEHPSKIPPHLQSEWFNARDARLEQARIVRRRRESDGDM